MSREEGTGSVVSQIDGRERTAQEGMYREIDPAETPSRRVYGLLTSVVVPRPIAWVSSQNLDGVPNVAPHSYFTVLSHQPPQLGFVSVGETDTLRNVRETGEYVINVAGEELAERLNRTAANFPPEESEFAWAGLTPELASKVAAPRVGEAPVSLEMRLTEIKPIGDCFLVIGEVVWVRIAEAVMRGDHVAPDLLRALGRHAGPTYSRTVDHFDLQRPTYKGLLEEGAGPMESASKR
jgi:flavin reductase (DIM6/NTAB) family NADH-FMN oxidoreductase RutF